MCEDDDDEDDTYACWTVDDCSDNWSAPDQNDAFQKTVHFTMKEQTDAVSLVKLNRLYAS